MTGTRPASAVRRPNATRRAVVAGLAGVAVGAGLFVGLSLLAGSGGVEVGDLGDREFRAGEAASLADAVARDGPVLFADASPNGERDIYVQHLAQDDERGWVSFSAQAPGAERACVLRWSAEDEEMVDPCGARRFPADGEGLTAYPTRVEDGVLVVDLREGRPTDPAG